MWPNGSPIGRGFKWVGGLVAHYLNVGMALWRLVKSIEKPPLLPKRLDQFLFALAGGHYSITISRWARHNSDKLYTKPIVWLTEPFDRFHVPEIDDERPYTYGPGFGWALLGNTIVLLIGRLLWLYVV